MPLKHNKLSAEEQEALLDKHNIFLGNRYRISERYRRICDISEEITVVTIEEVWQMTHLHSGKKSTMLYIRYNDDTSDHQPVDFIEDLLCQPFPKRFKK